MVLDTGPQSQCSKMQKVYPKLLLFTYGLVADSASKMADEEPFIISKITMAGQLGLPRNL